MAKKKSQKTPDFRNMPFREVVEHDKNLAELRRHYRRKSVDERRRAADWTYHQSAASDTFGRTLSRAGKDASMFAEEVPPGFKALALPSGSPTAKANAQQLTLSKLSEHEAEKAFTLQLPRR